MQFILNYFKFVLAFTGCDYYIGLANKPKGTEQCKSSAALKK